MFSMYIDPGTGMIIVQMVLAAFVSVFVFFKNVREKIKAFFRKK